MEKILTETTYTVPYDRWVELGITEYDKSVPVHVQITDPSGFETSILRAVERRGTLCVAVQKMIGRKFLNPKMRPRVTLKVYQEVSEVAKPEPVPSVCFNCQYQIRNWCRAATGRTAGPGGTL